MKSISRTGIITMIWEQYELDDEALAVLIAGPDEKIVFDSLDLASVLTKLEERMELAPHTLNPAPEKRRVNNLAILREFLGKYEITVTQD